MRWDPCSRESTRIRASARMFALPSWFTPLMLIRIIGPSASTKRLGDRAVDPGCVAHAVEVALLRADVVHEAVVAGEVGRLAADHDMAARADVVGHLHADALGERRIPVDPLDGVPCPGLVLRTEAADPLAVLVLHPQRRVAVGRPAGLARITASRIRSAMRAAGTSSWISLDQPGAPSMACVAPRQAEDPSLSIPGRRRVTGSG